jgi:hypothetical protein
MSDEADGDHEDRQRGALVERIVHKSVQKNEEHAAAPNTS